MPRNLNMRKHVQLLVIALLSAMTIMPTAASDLFDLEWEQKRDRDGIAVFTGDVPDSRLKAVMSTMRVTAQLGQLVALVRDANACPEWADLCKKAEHVEVISETEMYVYTLNDLPWPVSDRDAVAHVLWEQSPDTLTVQMTATVAADKLPKTKAVRIPYGITRWTFAPHDDGEVTVISHAHVDPGGATPAWLTNRLLVDSPFTTMQKMREIVSSGRYADSTFEFLTEPGSVE